MTTSDTATDERWYVQLDSQEVRLMSLDELDEAFQQGLIHENTYLIKVGEKNWQTLADTLGAADEEEEPAVAAEPDPVPVPAPASHQHATAASIPAAAVTAPRPGPAGAASNSWPPAVAGATGGGAWPPSVAAPSASVPPPTSAAPFSPGPRSTIPVVQDVSDDFDAPFKPRRRGLWLFAAAAAVAVGGAGYALTRLDAPPAPTAAAAPTVAAAAALTPFRPTTPSPASNPTPAPAPQPEPAKTDTPAKAESDRFSEDMKKALLAADKERVPAKRTSARSAPARRSTAKKSKSAPLKGSGNAHDPLDPTL